MLTVAIPNYDGARFLTDTLCSLDKNRPFVRWWLQDAVSTDGSVSIAREYAGPLDRIVVEQDQGQADALNHAFLHMGGEIIGFINSDDRLTDGAAEAILAEFEEDPALDLVYGEVDWIDACGSLTGHHCGNISNIAEVLNIYDVWWNHRQWVQPEVFWRRSLWEKVGPFNTAYELAFDYEYWVRCFRAGAKVKSIPRTLAQFRRHPGQKSCNADVAANEIRNIVKEALASGAPLTGKDRRRLETMISYDRYQSGQDYPNQSSRPSLARMLVRQPKWALLPSVRRRIARSALNTFSAG